VVTLSRTRPSGLAADLLKGAEVVVGDAGVGATLAPLVPEADHIVFGVSSLMPGEADAEPELDMALILRPLLELLSQLRGRSTALTLLSSGGTVYGKPEVFPTPESAPTNPVSSYGITRLTTEKFVLRHGILESSSVRVLRVSNAYGPGQTAARGQGFIAAALEHCQSGAPITIFGDGSVSRDFVHVGDVANAVAALVSVEHTPPVINIGSGTTTTINEVVEIVREVTHLPLRVELRSGRAFDVSRVHLDVELVSSLVPFEPRDLSIGIRGTWEHMLQGRP